MSRDNVLTVGALREYLANFHDAEEAVIAENNLLYRPRVYEKTTAIGTVVVIERGDAVVW